MLPSPNEEPETSDPDRSPEFRALARFAQLTARQRELARDKREVEKQLDALEPALLAYLTANNIPLIQIEGFTLSPVRVPWIYPLEGVERAAVCEALKLSGLGSLVKEEYSTASLTKYLSELEEHHKLLADPRTLQQLLPAPLAHVIQVKPGYRLQALDRRELTKQRRKES